MKVIGYIVLYITLTIGYYLLLSSIGILFFDKTGKHYTYEQCYSSIGWFMMYLFFIHWWLVTLSLREYYIKYVEKLF